MIVGCNGGLRTIFTNSRSMNQECPLLHGHPRRTEHSQRGAARRSSLGLRPSRRAVEAHQLAAAMRPRSDRWVTLFSKCSIFSETTANFTQHHSSARSQNHISRWLSVYLLDRRPFLSTGLTLFLMLTYNSALDTLISHAASHSASHSAPHSASHSAV